MKKINKILSKLELKPQSYRKEGNIYIVGCDDSKYVVKRNDNPIYGYLRQRNFDYYPETIIEDGYEIVKFEEDIEEPKEEKMNSLISLTALLHNKTTYYKTVGEYDYQEMYENLSKTIVEVKEYYHTLMDKVESETFMSPSSYLLARHITPVFNAISYCEYNLKKWYESIKDKRKIRQAIVHNNLSLDHYINNKLISWNRAKFSSPIFDIYHLYSNTYKDFVWEEVLNEYKSSYPLQEDELELFYILISIPKKIYLNNSEYQNTVIVNDLLDYIDLTGTFIEMTKKTS